tara:strand:+ start:501 stop:740 length:240 start_codon:yes stop_codon:yes gene_type:complete
MGMFLEHKPRKQHVQALYNCKVGSNALILELFEVKLAEIKDSLVLADDPVTVHRLQGKAIVLKEFLEAVEKSQEVLARL